MKRWMDLISQGLSILLVLLALILTLEGNADMATMIVCWTILLQFREGK